MYFDLKQVPFSRYGSYLAFSHVIRHAPEISSEDLYLRSVHGGESTFPLLKVDLTLNGKTIDFDEKASPCLLRLESSYGFSEICIAEPKLIRIRSKGVGIRLSIGSPRGFQFACPYGEGRYEINSHSQKLMCTPLQGKLHMDAPWEASNCRRIVADFIPGEDGAMECAIEEFRSVWKAREYDSPFDACLQKVEREYEDWLGKTLAVPEEYRRERELAAYVNWSSFVKPEGNIRRESMYMSKNWMANIWSWDYCFNAMSLIKTNPAQAWNQFQYLADYQDENGAMPDSVNDRNIVWNFVKPPIHGWALNWMMQRSDFIGPRQLAEIYGPLCKWTDWWMTYRDSDHDGLPQYDHGNDSGWDNATVFNNGSPIEGPDLAGFLVIQMQTLAKIADILGLPEESLSWQSRADRLLRAMLDQLWKGGRFVAPRSGSHEVCESDSLIVYLPILLGSRLPKRVLSAMIGDLKEKNRFLTDFGLATESIGSRFYEPDGYWRGPIWAPSTMIMVDGLVAAGEKEFAREIAVKFCDLIRQSGMSENFNAKTGEGLRDRAYTWTSSVFLILANEYI